ncbi:MAG: 5'/3'-nucleotidase SurE [Gammaproteobacteria bacterium]
MRGILHGLCAGLALLFGLGAPASALTILLTNDDGFHAPGILAMQGALRDAGHRVIVVAPRTDQSGSSVKITTTAFALKQEAPDVWVVDGSPADSVWVGLRRVLRDAPPDLVVSGGNRGQNLGAVTNLSGTVGAAVMAALNDVPAIAVSVGIDLAEAAAGFPSTAAAYPAAGAFTAQLVARLAASRNDGPLLPPRTVLNVNYPARPAADVRPARWTRLGAELGYAADYVDGDGADTVKLAFGPDPNPYAANNPHDTARFAAGHVTVTVLQADWLAPRAVRVETMRRVGDLVRP